MTASSVQKRRREPLTDAQLLMTVAVGIFVVMYAAAMIFMGDSGFLKPQMILDILNDNAALIIITVSLTIVMIGGGINISVGGVIGLTVMSCALLLNKVDSIPLAILLSLGIGLAFGAGMGALVSYLDIQPFIVTLAGMFLARGLTTIQSVDPVKVTSKIAPNFYQLTTSKLKISFLGTTAVNGNWIPGKLEIGAIVALVIVVLAYLMLRFTRLGREIYALGGNRHSARMLGVNVKRTCFWTYVISGLLSGIAGFVFLIHKPAGNASVAARSEMDAIASSIIGGTLLTGGVGNVIGSFFGVMILATIQKIVALSKLSESYWQDLASGALLGIFIIMQSVILARRAKAKDEAGKKNIGKPVQKE